MRATEVDQTEIAAEEKLPGATLAPARTKWGPRTLSPAASAHLDLIRAVAAWAVMWGHVRSNFFVDFEHLARKNLLLQGLYFVTGFGHQAVMVFFVLSGFLISSSVMHSYVSGSWSWREYAINRSSRLYVVLVPGLLLGLLWDKLGSIASAATGLYSQPLEGFGAAIAQNQITLGAFIGNLFFLQTILCPTFGSNGPLWSLANEFWYYALFPVALFAGIAWAKRAVPRALVLSIFTASLGVFLGWDKLVGFVIWLTGFGLVVAYSKLQTTSKSWLMPYMVVTSLVVAGCLVAARLGHPAALGSDLAVGIGFALFLFGVLDMGIAGQFRSYKRFSHFFAGFSYSLYVLHFPFVLFLRACIAPSERWQPDGRHLLYGAAVGMATLAFAWAVSTFTENKTSVVRQWMRNALPHPGGN